MKRLKKIVLSILGCIFIFISIGMSFGSDSIDIEKIKTKIDLLFASEDLQYEIIKISEPQNNVLAVFLNPTCRDFPNVIFFCFDQNLNDYYRVYEGLSVGIQDKPSGKVDLHTLGLGIDMVIDGGTSKFKNESVQKMFEIGNRSSFVVIPYQGFIHMHSKNTEFYTIDKTSYYDFALKLIGNVYRKYPKNSCLVFDTPNLTEADFKFDNGKYTVICKTDNKQLWTICFDGIDQNNRFLVNKKIEVKVAD